MDKIYFWWIGNFLKSCLVLNWVYIFASWFLFFPPPTNDGLTNPNWLVLNESNWKYLWIMIAVAVLQEKIWLDIFKNTSLCVIYPQMLTFQGSTWHRAYLQAGCLSVPPEGRGEGCMRLTRCRHPWSFLHTLSSLAPKLPSCWSCLWVGWQQGVSGSGSCARSNGQLYLP